MVNILIAKLIAYDALILAIRGNLIAVLGSNSISTTEGSSSSQTTGDIKSIETGPSKVEFHAAGDTMSSIIKSPTSASTNGNNIINQLSEDVCGLARKLLVKLPMCRAQNVVTIFQKVSKPKPKPTDPVYSRG